MKFLGLEIKRSGKKTGIDKRYYSQSHSISDVNLLSQLFPGLTSNTKSGVAVTEQSSMGLAAVFSSVRVISEDLASVPMEVIKTTSNNTRTKDKNYFLWDLVHEEPNHYQTAFTFYDGLTAMANLWGNSYALIHRNSQGQAAELETIHPTDVEYYIINRRLWYRVTGHKRLIKAENMIHISGPSMDGIAGVSMIRLHRETIGGAIAARDFGNTFFRNGANLNGVLSSDQKLNDEQIKKYSKNWGAKYTSVDKAHQTAVLGQGLKYQAIGVPPEDAQFIETSKYDRSVIAGIYRVKAHKINDLEKATFSNIEHLSIEHVNDTIRPWAKRIEQEFERKLIPSQDKGTYTLKFNLLALMRGDSKSRVEYYKGMQSIGAISANEVRTLEDINSYDGGDDYYVPLNSIPSDMVEDYFDAQINAINSKSDGK